MTSKQEDVLIFPSYSPKEGFIRTQAVGSQIYIDMLKWRWTYIGDRLAMDLKALLKFKTRQYMVDRIRMLEP